MIKKKLFRMLRNFKILSAKMKKFSCFMTHNVAFIFVSRFTIKTIARLQDQQCALSNCSKIKFKYDGVIYSNMSI